MGLRFNPAPGWPPPPPGFVPQPGWQPDPSWPPAPPGWQLWVADDVPGGSGATALGGYGPGGGAAAGVTSTGTRPMGAGAAPGYPWGYMRPSQPQGAHPFAVASFVVSLFGFTVIGIVVSVVFGILALLRIRERPQRGKGLAIAGLIISSVWFLFLVLVIVLAATSTRQQTENSSLGPTGSISVFDLRSGECFKNPSADERLLGLTHVTVVPCTRPHNAQVFAVFQGKGEIYPGRDALRRQAAQGCRSRLAGNVDKSKLTHSMTLRFIFPTAQPWGAGQHAISCFILNSRQQMIYSLVPADTTG